MDKNKIINELKEEIKNKYDETRNAVGEKIFRGHSRCISTDIEDTIARFISKILSEYKIFLDPSITINKKTYRPDLLVINQKDEVVAFMEIKARMGYCRDAKAKEALNKMITYDNKFKNNDLTCKFSYGSSPVKVKYDKNVKLFFVSLSSNNCSNHDHIKNNEYARNTNKHKLVSYFTLFKGIYDDLKNVDKELNDISIDNFYDAIIKL